MHLVAPSSPHNPEPVRTIADGELVFARHSDPMSPTSAGAEIKAAHPLLYYKGWTSNSVIVLKHETEIGEGVSVTFFPVYRRQQLRNRLSYCVVKLPTEWSCERH